MNSNLQHFNQIDMSNLKDIIRINYLRNIFIVSILLAVALPLTVIFYINPLLSELLSDTAEKEADRVAKHLMLTIVSEQRSLQLRDVPMWSRMLDIPTDSDRIAQMVVKRYLEPRLEPYFHPDW